MDIDDDGTVIGYVGLRPGQTNFIRPAHGAAHELAGPVGVSVSDVSSIRNGWVVGFGQVQDYLVGLRWDRRTGLAEVVSTDYPRFLSVNRKGDIGTVGAILRHNGRVTPLGDNMEVIVLSDRRTAAGTAGMFGPPTRWIDC